MERADRLRSAAEDSSMSKDRGDWWRYGSSSKAESGTESLRVPVGAGMRGEGNAYTWVGIWQFHCRLQQEYYRYGEKKEESLIDEALKNGQVDKTSRSDQCHKV